MSVILEYDQDQWRKIYGDKSWQVLTNKPIYNVSEAILRDKCWRYRSITETLENTKGDVDWKAGMKILRDVKQKGTTWSVVYSPPDKRTILLCLSKVGQYLSSSNTLIERAPDAHWSGACKSANLDVPGFFSKHLLKDRGRCPSFS